MLKAGLNSWTRRLPNVLLSLSMEPKLVRQSMHARGQGTALVATHLLGEGITWSYLCGDVMQHFEASMKYSFVGGKKNSFHHNDLWNLKYLPRFKWHHLTERIAYDNAVRDRRLAVETAKVQRETNAYVEQVVKASKIATAKRHGKERQDNRPNWSFKQKKRL
eukprot:m.24922 g.24922  ORF g.24922 m.24922 type:complete len:163 (-) comp11565_c0_seq10:720-1208(-)